MQLGGKPKTSDFLEAIKQSEGLNDLSISTQPQQQQQHNSHPASPINRVSAGPVHVLFDEKISAVLNRDGGLESMEVKGELILRLTDADKSKLRIAVATVQDDSLQFKVSQILFIDYYYYYYYFYFY
jgi:hypothetical protein